MIIRQNLTPLEKIICLVGAPSFDSFGMFGHGSLALYGALVPKILKRHFFQDWPILYGSRRATARIFQLNDNKSETAQDIELTFLAFVHHI